MRILLIEDYELLRKSVAQGLREAGYAVDAAGDGEEGLWYARTGDYDVIVLDLMLPKVDGLTILHRLREKKDPVHVLILTARDTLEDRVQGLNLGADDYLVKPFAFVELLARVRALLRRGQPIPERLQVGDLVLDCIRRKVTRGGETIAIKRRVKASQGVRSFWAARRTIAGYEAVNIVRKGQVRRVGKGEVAQQLRLVAQLFELTA